MILTDTTRATQKESGDRPANMEEEQESLCSLHILHFNDCYNVDPVCSEEPVGGAARFAHALHRYDHLDPIILFSGDILAPSNMSSFTQGEHMVPVLNQCKVDCALFGNHEFDFGLEPLLSFVSRTNFPWLMSNVLDKKTKNPLADGKLIHIIEKSGFKIGLIGLIEEEWLSTLVIDLNSIEYEDFVIVGRRLAHQLRSENKVDMVIALTHMRTHNDIRLAENVHEIDLILGGHDHVYEVKTINSKKIIKSGTDFRQFSKIELFMDRAARKLIDTKVLACDVTSNIPEDPCLLAELEKFKSKIESQMDDILAILDDDLDCRFSQVRTRETNSGNLITDVMLYSVPEADFAFLNSGTLRSDRIHPKGPFKRRDLVNMLPFMETLMVLNITGEQTLRALENGVSQYPVFEGRFAQVSGIKFAFDPSRPPGSRVDRDSVMIQNSPLELERTYRMVTKEFIALGRDGYGVLKECSIYKNTEECLAMLLAVQEYIEALRLVQLLEASTIKMDLDRGLSAPKFRRNSLHTFKQRCSDISDNSSGFVCRLNPRVEGRIVNKSELSNNHC